MGHAYSSSLLAFSMSDVNGPGCRGGRGLAFIRSFIHSFRLLLWRIFKSTILLRGAPDTARIGLLCPSFTPKRHRQLRVKDLTKVLTWRLERDSNPRPFGRKAPNLPTGH